MKDRYMLVYERQCEPYYDANTDENIEFGFSHTEYFDDIFRARKRAESLPDNCIQKKIWEIVEVYQDEE